MISGGVTSRAASVTICPPRLLSQQSGTFCNNGIPKCSTRSVVLHASITSLITPSRHLCIVHYQKDQSPLSSVSDQ
ncbi:hypothetical protein E4U36_005773 [Claviceps purpurea]|nr:hypothetical protein E4U36_005773 [Claviceps purpurea]